MSSSKVIPHVVDASIWVRIGRNHPRDIFKRFWAHLDAAIKGGELVSPDEVREELKRGYDDLAKELGARNGLFLPLDEKLGEATRRVEAECHLTDPDGERSRGDPFVVACALVNGWPVLSGERPRKGPNARMRIPDACKHLRIQHVDWFSFLRAKGWDL